MTIKYSVNEMQLLGIYCVVLLFISGTFIGIYDLGWKIFVPLLLFLLYTGNINYLHSSITLSTGNDIELFPALIITPVIAYLIITWNQEFPFVGDHDFHLVENYKSSVFWFNFKWQFIFLVLIFILALRFGYIKLWIPIAGSILIWWSRFDTLPWHDISNSFYVRYPATGRFFSYPFMYFAILAKADQMYNYSRIINIVALTSWACLFRPFFLGKKININLILFCLIFLYQKNVIYYFNTNYLEPLASIFILLAVECLFTLNQNNGYVAACLLIGLAATVKEQAIFILPWIWLAGKPWKWDLKQWKRGIAVGISSAVPFLIYYLVRMQRMPSGRIYKLITLDQWLDIKRYSIFFSRICYHLGGYGIIAMCFALILSVIAILKYKEYRVAILCIFGAIFIQLIFFIADENSVAYLGYFRFAFFAVSLVAGIVLSVEKISKDYMVWMQITCGFFFFAAVINLMPFFKNALLNDVTRNFIEHTDAPIYFPIKKLLEKAESQHALQKSDNIYIADTTGYHINALVFHYTKIAETYAIKTGKALQCKCDSDIDAVIIPFVYFHGMNAGLLESPHRPSPFAPLPARKVQSWFLADSKKEQCEKKVRETCQTVITEKFNGELIGLFGVGQRL